MKMELKGIILTVSLLCNVWFILLLLQEQIKETKLVRFLCGISELWKSMAGNPPSPQKEETEISKEIPDVIGKSKFKMSVAKSTAATPVPKEMPYQKTTLPLMSEIRKKAISPPKFRQKNWMKRSAA